MIAWLYTEGGSSLKDGPFFSIEKAVESRLWEWEAVCFWSEEHNGQGWSYENVRWTGRRWVTTSRGIRPLEVERPAFLLEARALGFAASGFDG